MRGRGQEEPTRQVRRLRYEYSRALRARGDLLLPADLRSHDLVAGVHAGGRVPQGSRWRPAAELA